MTITSKVNKIQIGSGSTIAIANLGVTDASQLVVVLLTAAVAPSTEDTESTLVNPTHYTVNSDLTTITLVTAIDGTVLKRATVTIAIPETQTSDYVNIKSHNTEVTEADLDKMTLKLKQVQEKLDRVMVAPISTPSGGSFDLPSLDGNADKYLSLNATEDGFEFSDITSITFWEGFALPSADGTAEQILKTDGAGNISWTDATSTTHAGLTMEALLVYNQVTDTIIRSSNVTSVSDDGTGVFTINFTTAISNSNYSISANARSPNDTNGIMVAGKNSQTKSTTQLGLNTKNDAGTDTDSPEIWVLIYV